MSIHARCVRLGLKSGANVINRTGIPLAAVVVLTLLGLPALSAGAAPPGTIDGAFGNVSTLPGTAIATETASGSIGYGVTSVPPGVTGAGDEVVVGEDPINVNQGTTAMVAARFTQSGAPDSTFGTQGAVRAFNNVANAKAEGFGVAVEPAGLSAAGDVVVAGVFARTAPYPQPALARFTPSGALDTTFATGSSTGSGTTTVSLSGYDDEFTAVAVVPPGEPNAGDIVAAGQAEVDNEQAVLVARYLPNGTPDSSFGTAGIVTQYFAGVSTTGDDQVGAVSIDGSGNVVVVGQAPAVPAGTCTDNSGEGALVARFAASNGDLDTSGFNPSGLTGAQFTATGTVTVQSPGGGAVLLASGESNDGCPFGDEASVVALESTSSSGQDIVVAGRQLETPTSPSGSFYHQPMVARLTSSGSLDATFGSGGEEFPNIAGAGNDGGFQGVAVDPDATGTLPMGLSIVLAGYVDTVGSSPGVSELVERLTTRGQPDSSFGSNGMATFACVELSAECGTAVAVQSDTKILVSGVAQATSVQGGGKRLAVQRILGTTLSVANSSNLTVNGSGAPLTAVFPVSLNVASPAPVTVGYTTQDGTAHAPGDYTATSGALTIPAGQTRAAITIPVNNGPNHAGTDQTFSVVLSGSAENVAVSTTAATVLLHHIGYRLVASDGGIFAYNAPFYGSMAGYPLSAPIVAIASDKSTLGYWEVASDGGVFSFNAPFYGSMGGQFLAKPIVTLQPTPDAGGYWEVASDGGIFAFGDAGFYGSMGGQPLNKPVVGLAVNAAGTGYWEIAADGGIFAFGAVQFYGSMGGTVLNKAIIGAAATVDGGGYWEVAGDGGIFAFGDSAFYGSMGGQPLNKPIVGFAVDPGTGGYWEVASDGGIFAFNAPFLGSTGSIVLNEPVVGISEA